MLGSPVRDTFLFYLHSSSSCWSTFFPYSSLALLFLLLDFGGDPLPCCVPCPHISLVVAATATDLPKCVSPVNFVMAYILITLHVG